MDERIRRLAREYEGETIKRRRDLHRYPEAAWTEFRTASIVASCLANSGYKVLCGDEVIDTAEMMGLPPAEELKAQVSRALDQGAECHWLEKMQGGKTGVVGIWDFGREGPTVALRFDMDANDINEAEDSDHRPFQENFCSVNAGVMHACGHDGHTAVGLTVAEILSKLKDDLVGRVKLIFQPAEEGVRGAKSIAAKGIVDDVDFFIAMHLVMALGRTGEMACRTDGFLATTKLDAEFIGVTAHAAEPEKGRNALLAAANAALNLHGIPRHSMGSSRINVGVLEAGTGRNVIPGKAFIKLETRGKNSIINDFICGEACRVIQASAAMYDVDVAVTRAGAARDCESDAILGDRIGRIAERIGLFTKIIPVANAKGSEDCTWLMERVRRRGGLATYITVGADTTAGQHNSRFDFDEAALCPAVAILACVTADLLRNKFSSK